MSGRTYLRHHQQRTRLSLLRLLTDAGITLGPGMVTPDGTRRESSVCGWNARTRNLSLRITSHRRTNRLDFELLALDPATHAGDRSLCVTYAPGAHTRWSITTIHNAHLPTDHADRTRTSVSPLSRRQALTLVVAMRDIYTS